MARFDGPEERDALRSAESVKLAQMLDDAGRTFKARVDGGGLANPERPLAQLALHTAAEVFLGWKRRSVGR